MRLMEGESLARILAIAVGLLMVVPATYIVGFGTPRELATAETTFVYFGSENDRDALMESGVEILEIYDSFALVRTTTAQNDMFQSQGMIVDMPYDLHAIHVNGIVIDTNVGEPEITANLRLEAYRSDVDGHYLVQFHGPVKEAWKQDIERLGGRVLNYIPNDAFIVQLDAELLDDVRSLTEVQWLGVFQPAYKIRPALFEMSGRVSVKIITFANEGLGQVISSLHRDQITSYFETDDFGVVKAEVDVTDIPSFAKLNSVQYIEPIYEMEPTNANMQWIMQTDVPDNRRLWDMGLHGEGQIIAVADTGLDFDHRFFREDGGTVQTGDIYNVTDLGRRKVVRYQTMSHWIGIDRMTDPWAWKDSAYMWVAGNITSGHGTMVSGTLTGNDDPLGASLNDGIAKGAKIYFQDIGTLYKNPEWSDWWDDSLRFIPDDYHDLFWDPYNDSARIHSNSWGAKNIDYDLEAMMVDKFMWEYPEMLVVFSTGNDGLNGPGSPATAKNTIAVGWHDPFPNQDRVDASSSVGPTEDGRRTPTVMAVGEGISSRSSGNNWDNSNIGNEIAWAGTSYSGPVVSGLAAITRQYYMEGWYPTGGAVPANGFTPSGALLKSTIAVAGQQMQGTRADRRNEGTWPNNAQGWGRVVLDNALYFPGDASRLHIVDHTEGLATGESVEYTYYVSSGAIPFKVAMAYSDYPGATPTTKALVNNLDLLVTSPTGATFKGNAFWTGKNVYTTLVESRPDFGSYDIDNPLEAVLDLTPSVGFWKVRVTGTNVPSGPQPFALSIIGATDPGYGQLFLDRTLYGDSDTITITVEDADAVGPLIVPVYSDTETGGENVTLLEIGSGVFEGAINTAFGTPTADGALQVSEDDTVTVEYADTTVPIRTLQQTALIDGAPPMITGVKATRITNAAATIVWNTDESATSTVYYDTSPVSLTNTAVKTPAGLFVSHSIDVIDLQTGVKYYFDVESTDRFGHTTLDDNQGQHYSFVTTEKAELLLVIGDDTFPPESVDRYKNAFESFGWSYNEWYVDRSGVPTLMLLQGYKVVLWQTGLEEYPPFEPEERVLITNYIDEGGRFFVSSHDVVWALAKDSGSEYASIESGQWVNSTLKADWDIDPSLWTANEGSIGDPISNEYVGINRVNYEPHRSGGSGDEVIPQSYGGTVSTVWKNYGIDASPGDIGLKWVSSAANGTAGPGNVWGGQPSKLALCFFEVSRVNFASMNDLDRGSIINKTVVWLIGHDHPDVQVIAPNGGEVFVGNTVQIDWSRQVYSSGVNSQALFYSPDDGQSWVRITPDPLPGDTAYNWDVSLLQNGIHYRVKVAVEDDGVPYPMLNGTDISDDTFTILKPGGDSVGPITVPGSINAVPNPAERYTPITFTATVDDTNYGNSMIQAVEFYMDAPGPDGGGTPMSPVDIFDTALEQATWTGSADWPPGVHCIFIHGQDAANNWGEWESRCFTMLGKVVQAASNFMARITGFAHGDVTLTWTLSPDDPLDVTNYAIYSGTSYDPTAASYSFLASVPNQTDMYVHAGAGSAISNYYYAIYSNSSGGDSTMASQQAAKYWILLIGGVNFISVPITPSDPYPATVFKMMDTKFRVWTYDPLAGGWDSFNSVKAYGGGLSTIMPGKGYWLDVPAADDLHVAGYVQTQVPIELISPWTLVGYPSLTVSMTVGDLKATTGATKVEGYSAAAPYHLQELADVYVLAPGEAYWVGGADFIWQVYI
ncbi:MAG: S8 family serine peptidase [Thermoplasmata archaeon]